MEEVKISIDNKDYIPVMELAADYSLTNPILTLSSSLDPTKTPPKAGAILRLFLSDDLIAIGYIDSVVENLDNASHSITINARSKLSLLADCTMTLSGLTDLSLSNILEQITAPYGLTYELKNGDPTLKSFSLTSEAPLDKIAEVTEPMGMQLLANRGEVLILVKAGLSIGKQAAITDCLSYQASESVIDRYNTYTIKSNNLLDEPVIVQASDKAINKYKKLEVLSSRVLSNEEAENIAENTATGRLKSSNTYQINLDRWRDADGTPWQLGFETILAFLPTQPSAIITGIRYVMNASEGQITTLDLVPK